MNKKQRVMAAVTGQQPDRVPTGFWLHFPPDMHHGVAAVEAHLKFFKETETDIFKVMNENLMPKIDGITKASDFNRIKPLNLKDRFIIDQLDIIKRIADAVGDEAVVLHTIHGTIASVFHSTQGRDDYEALRSRISDFLREDPQTVSNAFKVISEGIAELTAASIDAGAQGIYYSALGGERSLFTDEEFEQYVKPNDLMILGAAKNAEAFNVLHICKDNVNLNRYKDYNPQVVNWAVYENNPPLKEGRNYFPGSTLLGGFDDRSGVLVDGTPEQIEETAFAILDELGTKNFILGSDCTVPTEISYQRLKAATVATEKYSQR